MFYKNFIMKGFHKSCQRVHGVTPSSFPPTMCVYEPAKQPTWQNWRIVEYCGQQVDGRDRDEQQEGGLHQGALVHRPAVQDGGAQRHQDGSPGTVYHGLVKEQALAPPTMEEGPAFNHRWLFPITSSESGEKTFHGHLIVVDWMLMKWGFKKKTLA